MKPKEIRLCNLPLEIRSAADTNTVTLRGYAAVFNSDSELNVGGRGLIEQIKQGAFTRTLTANTDVLALWNHDSNEPIARTPDTLRLVEDAKGLAVEIDLPDTQRAKDIAALIKSNVIRGMSFGFNIVKDEYGKRADGQIVHTITDVDLVECSIVTFPAYTETSISLRTVEDTVNKDDETAQNLLRTKEKLKLNASLQLKGIL